MKGKEKKTTDKERIPQMSRSKKIESKYKQK